MFVFRCKFCEYILYSRGLIDSLTVTNYLCIIIRKIEKPFGQDAQGHRKRLFKNLYTWILLLLLVEYKKYTDK